MNACAYGASFPTSRRSATDIAYFAGSRLSLRHQVLKKVVHVDVHSIWCECIDGGVLGPLLKGIANIDPRVFFGMRTPLMAENLAAEAD